METTYVLRKNVLRVAARLLANGGDSEEEKVLTPPTRCPVSYKLRRSVLHHHAHVTGALIPPSENPPSGGFYERVNH